MQVCMSQGNLPDELCSSRAVPGSRLRDQVPHRPPKKNTPEVGCFSLVDGDLNLRPREGGGEKRLGRFARTPPEASCACHRGASGSRNVTEPLGAHLTINHPYANIK